MFHNYHLIINLLLFILISNNLQLIFAVKQSNPNEINGCLIRNRLYSNEYLFTSNEIWRQYLRRNVYTLPLSEVDQLNKITWSLIPIHTENDTILIKSNKFNEYLCGYDKNPDMTNGIRPTLVKFNLALIPLYDRCAWQLRKVKSNDNNPSSYLIWNVKYKQPLYSASFLFKESLQKRNIFLWPKPIKSISKLSDEFFWTIDFITNNNY